MWDMFEYELVGAPTSSYSNIPHMGWKTSIHPKRLGRGLNSHVKITSPGPPYMHMGWKEVLQPMWDIGEHELVEVPN